MPRGRTIPEFLKKDDAKRLLEAPYLSNIRDRIILGLMLECGLRAGELVPSRRQKTTYERNEDGKLVRDEKRNKIRTGVEKWISKGLRKQDFEYDDRLKTARIKVIGGKGSKDRYVPIPIDDLGLLIMEYIEKMNPEDLLFDISISSIDPLVKRYTKRANIKEKVWPHKLRHTFAVNALRAGWNIKELQVVLGHEHLSTTEKYLHITDEDLSTVHKRHPIKYEE